ncbi:MAG: hypothetical protein LBF40_07815 [Deltaproteobacteria bacterium]|nr:hypothetical protein [Deltaproteobacteria bacterium]
MEEPSPSGDPAQASNLPVAKARYLGTNRGESLFFLEKLPEGFLDSDYFELVRGASETPKDTSAQKPSLQGAAGFMDPAFGWLTEVASPPGQGPGAWVSLPEVGPPPLGLSFLSAPAGDFLKATIGLLARLPKEETAMVVSSDIGLLTELAKALEESGKDYPFYPHEEAPGALFPISLARMREDLKVRWEAEERSLMEDEAGLVARESSVKAGIDTHRGLATLEANLIALREEVAQREREWAGLEMAHGMALLSWQEAARELGTGKAGLFGMLSGKKDKEQKKEREKRAKEGLELAERALGQARREKEDFVREARGLKEELLRTRALAERLPPQEELNESLRAVVAELSSVREGISSLRQRIRAANSQAPSPGLLQGRGTFLCRPDYARELTLPQGRYPDNLIRVGPRLWSHASRKAMLADTRYAGKRFMAVHDYGPLRFGGGVPSELMGEEPWHSFLVSPALPRELESKRPMLAALRPSHVFVSEILPEGVPSLGLKGGLAVCPIPGIPGLSFRAFGETGPANPVSALCAARLAERKLAADPDGLTIALTASPFQARLIRAMAKDLGIDSKAFQAGEPDDFEGAGKAGLVILDPGLGPPHTGHPWARGDEGAKAILKGLSKAQGALVLVASEDTLSGLPKNGPLRSLYANSPERAYLDPRLGGGPSPQEALDKAKEFVLAILPPMEPMWWGQLAPHVNAAIGRGVNVTVITDLPPPDNREYPGNAIRDLRIAGAMVLLGQGFPSMTVVVDDRVLCWGFAENLPGPKAWKGVKTRVLENAAPLVTELLQLPLIREKLGKGSFRNCPSCGWPYLLINQDRQWGFGDLNSLKLGCINEGCPAHKKPRALDERWPFLTPPLCQEDNSTPYLREDMGKRSQWLCPRHPDGPCPRHRVIPGDPK